MKLEDVYQSIVYDEFAAWLTVQGMIFKKQVGMFYVWDIYGEEWVFPPDKLYGIIKLFAELFETEVLAILAAMPSTRAALIRYLGLLTYYDNHPTL